MRPDSSDSATCSKNKRREYHDSCPWDSDNRKSVRTFNCAAPSFWERIQELIGRPKNTARPCAISLVSDPTARNPFTRNDYIARFTLLFLPDDKTRIAELQRPTCFRVLACWVWRLPGRTQGRLAVSSRHFPYKSGERCQKFMLHIYFMHIRMFMYLHIITVFYFLHKPVVKWW